MVHVVDSLEHVSVLLFCSLIEVSFLTILCVTLYVYCGRFNGYCLDMYVCLGWLVYLFCICWYLREVDCKPSWPLRECWYLWEFGFKWLEVQHVFGMMTLCL